MTIVGHGLVTAAGVAILGLSGSEVWLAAAFGIMVDADHILKLPAYLTKHQFPITHLLRGPYPKERYYNWRTSIQEPVALLWIVPLSIYLGTAIPVLFFSTHLLLDYLMDYRKMPFFPYSDFTTSGLLTGLNDIAKEAVVSIGSLCAILLVT